MPYIDPRRRPDIDDPILNAARVIRGPGELNYAITKLIDWYLQVRVGGLNYAGIAEVTGVLKNTADEFYRRVGVPYEAQKCEDHGDVYAKSLTTPH